MNEFTDFVTLGSFSFATAVACPGLDLNDFVAGREQRPIKKRLVLIYGACTTSQFADRETEAKQETEKVTSRGRARAVTYTCATSAPGREKRRVA